MKIFIIWENEDGATVYSIEENDEEVVEKIKAASGQIVNQTEGDCEEAVWLEGYLLERKKERVYVNEVVTLKPNEHAFFVHAGWF